MELEFVVRIVLLVLAIMIIVLLLTKFASVSVINHTIDTAESDILRQSIVLIT